MARLSLFVGSGDSWSWVVVSDGGQIMAGRRWWWVVVGGGELMLGCGWSWVVAAKLWLVVDGCEWSWLVARFSNALKSELAMLEFDSYET